MEIQTVSQEIISQEDYEPTGLDNVFTNQAKQTVCIVGQNEAMVLRLKEAVS